MARSALTDYLQVYPFWLVDVAPIEPLALPLFTPMLGFSEITAPEISLDTKDIVEGTGSFKRKVIKQASVSDVTLKRAATFHDGDFWRWVVAAVTGSTGGFTVGPVGGVGALGGPSPRRNLLLVHAFAQLPFPPVMAANALTNAALLASVSATVSTGAWYTRATVASLTGVLGAGYVERMPARAFLLKGCLPVRYKVGGDFDAKSGEISIKELELAVEELEEISLSA